MNQYLKVCLCSILAVIGLIAFSEVFADEFVWDEDSQSLLVQKELSNYSPRQPVYGTDQPRLMWDDIHDNDNDDLFTNYSQCSTIMDSLGIAYQQISVGVISAAMLDTFDILVLIDEEIEYLVSEITDIQNWVNAGGKLLVIGENAGAFNMASHNALLQPYNMQFADVSTYEATNFATHPITQGLSRISWSGGGAVTYTNPAMGLAWNNSNSYAVTIYETGAMVLILNDSGMMNNSAIGNDDNYQCFVNSLVYLIETFSTLNLTLTPLNSPIVIPSGGGSFNFIAEIENPTDNPITFDVWSNIILPNGGLYGPLIRRNNLTVPAHSSFMRNLMQFIPWNAPPGNYNYIACAGIYPDSVNAEDSFSFLKTALNNGGFNIVNWDVDGWEDAPGQLTPNKYRAISASPNPFNPVTTLTYEIKVDGIVNLKVFDVSGKEVIELAEGFHPAGEYRVQFSGEGLPSGVYFARLTTNGKSETLKLLLMK